MLVRRRAARTIIVDLAVRAMIRHIATNAGVRVPALDRARTVTCERVILVLFRELVLRTSLDDFRLVAEVVPDHWGVLGVAVNVLVDAPQPPRVAHQRVFDAGRVAAPARVQHDALNSPTLQFVVEIGRRHVCPQDEQVRPLLLGLYGDALLLRHLLEAGLLGLSADGRALDHTTLGICHASTEVERDRDHQRNDQRNELVHD